MIAGVRCPYKPEKSSVSNKFVQSQRGYAEAEGLAELMALLSASFPTVPISQEYHHLSYTSIELLVVISDVRRRVVLKDNNIDFIQSNFRLLSDI